MDKTKNAVDQFLSESQEKSQFDPIIDPFEIPLEQKEEVVLEEKPLPFHKDPKVQKYLDREIKKALEGREPREKEAPSQSTDDFKDVMDSFTAVVGNDTPEKIKALSSLHSALQNLDSKAARSAEAKIEEIAQRERESDRAAEEELENAFESIEENFDVDLTSSRGEKLRSEFVTFVEKIAPKDRNGEIVDYPDMNSAWETFSEIRKSSHPNRAKELASRGMSRSTGTASVQPKKMDWQAVDEYMDSIK